MANNPTLLTQPIAANGAKNVIPNTTSTAGAMSQDQGFPAETALPLGAGGVAPSREDFNGAFNLLSGIVFMAQKGFVFNFDNLQDYYVDCVVRDPTDEQKYECIVDAPAGTGAPHETPANWKKIGSGSGRTVGDIFLHAGNGENPQGALLCDGAAVSRTMYPDLFEKIGTTYGAGDGSTTFNLPNLSDNRFVEGSTTAGTAKSAGLPNIEGTLASNANIFNNDTGGAFSEIASGGTGTYGIGYEQANGYRLSFNASHSNPIYGNSDTVQPKSLTLRYFIQAFDGQTPDSALIDITQYANELAGKADRNLSNLSVTGEARLANMMKYPDYDSEIAVTNTTGGFVYTCPSDGYIKISRASLNGSEYAKLFLGEDESGVPIGSGLSGNYGRIGDNTSSSSNGVNVLLFPASSGDKFYFNTTSTSFYLLSFIPAKA